MLYVSLLIRQDALCHFDLDKKALKTNSYCLGSSVLYYHTHFGSMYCLDTTVLDFLRQVLAWNWNYLHISLWPLVVLNVVKALDLFVNYNMTYSQIYFLLCSFGLINQNIFPRNKISVKF
jgi:hypothetical protein